jgi:hypothetical protein
MPHIEPRLPAEAQHREYGQLLDREANTDVARRQANDHLAVGPHRFLARQSGIFAVACGVVGLVGAVFTFNQAGRDTVRSATWPVTVTAAETTKPSSTAAPTSRPTSTTTSIVTAIPDSTVADTAPTTVAAPTVAETTAVVTTSPPTSTPTTATPAPPVKPTSTVPTTQISQVVTSAATTTTTSTTATTTTTTVATLPPLTTKQAAGRLPHLQLNVTEFQFNRPTHGITSRLVGNRTDAAVTSTWTAKGRYAYLVVANAAVRFTSRSSVTVRGKLGDMTRTGDIVAIRWQEADGVVAQLTTFFMTDAEALSYANDIITVGDEPWTLVLKAAGSFPPPNPWESVLVDNTR